jgi:hypothetical protein
MMARQKDDIDQLERALTEVYRSRSDADLDSVQLSRLSRRVMRDIRQAPGVQGDSIPTVVLEQLVWRTATIAAAVVLVVTVLTAGALRSMPEETVAAAAEEWDSAPLFGD